VLLTLEADVTETPDPAGHDESVMQEMTEEVLQSLINKLSAQQIRLVLEDVCTEMLSGLEV